jgi:hypothetical protein
VSTEPSTTNEATLTVGRPELLGPVLGRVVGMLAARAQCPIDRLDDALLLTDAVAAHAPGHTIDSASLPGVGNVFERVADDVSSDGQTLVLHLAFRTDTSN